MTRILFIQLPVPQINFGRQTGNIPLGGACLASALNEIADIQVDILPESKTAYLCDAALLDIILTSRPDIIGFTVYAWNLERSLYLADEIKCRYRPRIIMGGPEVALNHSILGGPVPSHPAIDFFALGEGESLIKALVEHPETWQKKKLSKQCLSMDSTDLFSRSPSPYPAGLLEPEIENMMLLETQRGCQYKCGYCNYSKSRKKRISVDEHLLFNALEWAKTCGIKEVYLLDPSLDTRPKLRTLLKDIASVNSGRELELISEIRAEAVDAALAALMAKAGFTWVEIGLQSTNPSALKIMNRRTDLKRFLNGVSHLKSCGISPCIDVIAGLPGDDLKGFKQTIEFILENDLQDHCQVFPLCILPGTDFRENSAPLGLSHDPHPPYHVTRSPGFSEDLIYEALIYAEDRLDLVLYPLPDFDASWRLQKYRKPEPAARKKQISQTNITSADTPDLFGDRRILIGRREYIFKVGLTHHRPAAELSRISRRLTQPFQILVGREMTDTGHLKQMLEIFSTANPFTPFEILFFEPKALPDIQALMPFIHLQRPGYLDASARFQYEHPGNRSVLFTLVSKCSEHVFEGNMQRQVFWWRAPSLPDKGQLERLAHLDGLLLDVPLEKPLIDKWQTDFAGMADHLFPVSFAGIKDQHDWIKKTLPGEYAHCILDRCRHSVKHR